MPESYYYQLDFVTVPLHRLSCSFLDSYYITPITTLPPTSHPEPKKKKAQNCEARKNSDKSRYFMHSFGTQGDGGRERGGGAKDATLPQQQSFCTLSLVSSSHMLFIFSDEADSRPPERNSDL